MVAMTDGGNPTNIEGKRGKGALLVAAHSGGSHAQQKARKGGDLPPMEEMGELGRYRRPQSTQTTNDKRWKWKGKGQ